MRFKIFAIAAIVAATAIDILFVWCFCRIASKSSRWEEEQEDIKNEPNEDKRL